MSQLAHHERNVGGLSPVNFERLVGLVRRQCGINLSASKQTMLEGRLRRRARDLGIEDLNHYCTMLFEKTPSAQEILEFLDVVTTNKTDFFREPVHFDYLVSVVLPEQLKINRHQINLWSAAASIGAEAYTLGMVTDSFAQQYIGFNYSIFGTDLSSRVLAQAVSGRYDHAMIEPIPFEFRRRYVLTARDPKCSDFRIIPALRQKTTFARLNLISSSYPVPDNFDVIFCRNVLIYFDKPTQAIVLTQLCRHLREGGYLFLGHSESATGTGLPLELVTNTVYRKR